MLPVTRPRAVSRLLSLPVAASGFTMLAAACGTAYGGGSSSGSGGVYGGGPSSAGAAASASVAVATSGLGKILTDGQGRTLYLFTKDKGSASSCTGSCTGVWPAFTASGAAQAESGAAASLLGTSTNSGLPAQITYNGHPLYYYVGDNKPGDTNGQNLDQFGGSWYVLSASGMQVGQ